MTRSKHRIDWDFSTNHTLYPSLCPVTSVILDVCALAFGIYQEAHLDTSLQRKALSYIKVCGDGDVQIVELGGLGLTATFELPALLCIGKTSGNTQPFGGIILSIYASQEACAALSINTSTCCPRAFKRCETDTNFGLEGE